MPLLCLAQLLLGPLMPLLASPAGADCLQHSMFFSSASQDLYNPIVSLRRTSFLGGFLFLPLSEIAASL